MCDCQFCTDIRHLKNQGVSREFLDRYINESATADFNAAVLDGSWPSAVELLTSALENATKRREQNECIH